MSSVIILDKIDKDNLPMSQDGLEIFLQRLGFTTSSSHDHRHAVLAQKISLGYWFIEKRVDVGILQVLANYFWDLLNPFWFFCEMIFVPKDEVSYNHFDEGIRKSLLKFRKESRFFRKMFHKMSRFFRKMFHGLTKKTPALQEAQSPYANVNEYINGISDKETLYELLAFLHYECPCVPEECCTAIILQMIRFNVITIHDFLDISRSELPRK